LTTAAPECTHHEASGRVVPTPKALKKGANRLQRKGGGSLQPSATDDGSSTVAPRSLTVQTNPPRRPLPPVHRMLAHDGVYEVRDTDLGTFTARIPGEVSVMEGFSLKVPKAPVYLLEQAVKIFKERPDREVLLTIMYDHSDARHHLAWVDQRATATSIDYDAAPEDEDLIVYAEIHSHNSMDAYFSATDDGSEARSTGLYGVIGRVDRHRPHAAFRYSCGHHFRRIPASSLFDDPVRVAELLSEIA
ncbi:MAG: Mov34/MPN/PAD-1 family protein, partial [Rubrobacter sp.]|nr:Mov34/MPN/PAD-1 family protein [Rubrobacter sp.]